MLKHNKSCFYWAGTKDTAHLAKAAGLRRDSGSGRYFTKDPHVAARLRAYADPISLVYIKAAEGARDLGRALSLDDLGDLVPKNLTKALHDYRSTVHQYPLFEYQKAGVAALVLKNNALLGDDMGLGKTAESLVAAGLLKAKRILVVCPNSVCLNWRREAEEWCAPGLDVQLVRSQEPYEHSDQGIAVVPWHLLSRRFNVMDALMAAPWDVIIFDECHNAKNPKSQRTQQAYGHWKAQRSKDNKSKKWVRHRGLADNAKRLWCMSGTPVPNRPIELQTTLTALGCDWARRRRDYGNRYCGGSYGPSEFRDATNLGELHTKLIESVLIRRRKAEVLSDLPPKRRSVVPLPIPDGDAFADLRQVARELDHRIPPETRASIVEAVGRGACPGFEDLSKIRHEMALAKAPLLAAYIVALLEENENENLLVFAHHQDVIQTIANIVAETFKKTRSLHGGNTPKMEDRQALVDRFSRGEIRCLVVGTSILKEGVNGLQKAASTCVFAEPDWVPGNLAQAEDRLHRIGQKGSVLCLYPVVANSIEVYILNAVAEKIGNIEYIIDGIAT